MELVPVTSKMLPRLMPTRSVPGSVSLDRASWVMVGILLNLKGQAVEIDAAREEQ